MISLENSATGTFYPSKWQRVSGDPHGQVAKAEVPSPFGDETLSFDFPNKGGTHKVDLWTHATTGKPYIVIANMQ